EVVDSEHPSDRASAVDLGAAGMGIHAPPAAQRFDPAEDRASPRPDVLAVLETVAAGPPRARITGVAEQLVWLLVHAHHRARRVVRTAVDRPDVLHPRRELRICPRRNGPALLQVRTKFRFFSTRPMVEWSRFGMSSASPACFSNSRRDHRERPAGGCEHANAISLASTSPVTREGTGGDPRFFPPHAAPATPTGPTHPSTTSAPT